MASQLALRCSISHYSPVLENGCYCSTWATSVNRPHFSSNRLWRLAEAQAQKNFCFRSGACKEMLASFYNCGAWKPTYIKTEISFKTKHKQTLIRSKGWHYLDVLCVMSPYSAVPPSLLLSGGTVRGVGRLEYLWLVFNIEERAIWDDSLIKVTLIQNYRTNHLWMPNHYLSVAFFFMKMWKKVSIATRWLMRPQASDWYVYVSSWDKGSCWQSLQDFTVMKFCCTNKCLTCRSTQPHTSVGILKCITSGCSSEVVKVWMWCYNDWTRCSHWAEPW